MISAVIPSSFNIDPPRLGRVQSLLMLMKPGIVLSVMFTAFGAMILASQGLPPLLPALIGLCSLFLSASGASILNNILDSKLDACMERSRLRQWALHEVGKGGALFIALAMTGVSLTLASLALNPMVGLLLLAAILGYVVFYTLLFKRRSPYGTIPGGIPGALPVLIGYASIKPQIGLDGLTLFGILFLWQTPHFLTLALRYQEDYKRAGIPVMPVVFGEPYTLAFSVLYGAALVPLPLALWLWGPLSGGFALFAVGLGGWFFLKLFGCFLNRKAYKEAFLASLVYVLGLVSALMVDLLL